MIKLWLAGKLRFLSHVGCFLSGLLAIIVPWYVFLIILAGSLVLDYFAFASEYSE